MRGERSAGRSNCPPKANYPYKRWWIAGTTDEVTAKTPLTRRILGMSLSPNETHYWWIMARDHGHAPDAVKSMTSLIEYGFNEDKVVFEAIEKRKDWDVVNPLPAIERSVAADKAGIEACRQLQRLLEKQSS